MRIASRSVSHFGVDELLPSAEPVVTRRRGPSLKAATDMAWSGLLVATLYLAGAPGAEVWPKAGVFDIDTTAARPALYRLDAGFDHTVLAVDPAGAVDVPLQAVGSDADRSAAK